MIWRILVILMLCCGAAKADRLRLVSTTTTENSGLMDVLLPLFEAETGIKVALLVTGTGQALRIGRQGDADALLVHDPLGEAEFVAQGYSAATKPVMYNHFLVVGPSADPAGIGDARSAAEVFAKIAQAKESFVSRGDKSGTHHAELRVWSQAQIEPKGHWYRETGSGMGATLNMASALSAYTLVDLASWVAFENRAALASLFENRRELMNPYSLHLINPVNHDHVNYQDAHKLLLWLTSEKIQKTISQYRVNGAYVFCPQDSATTRENADFCDF